MAKFFPQELLKLTIKMKKEPGNKGKERGLIMKKLGLLFGLMLVLVFSVLAQDIKEVDGVYFKGKKPYSGKYVATYNNGNPKIEMNLVNGLKDGEVKVYFENGNVNEVRSYKMNVMDGLWVTYNEMKVKIAEARYSNGKKDGKWLIWDDKGTLIYELEYTKGEKTGMWKQYDSSGNLLSERYYSLP